MAKGVSEILWRSKRPAHQFCGTQAFGNANGRIGNSKELLPSDPKRLHSAETRACTTDFLVKLDE